MPLRSRSHVIVRCDGAGAGVEAGIFPPYFERYIESVCGNIPERVREACVRGMQIPSMEEQQTIIADLDTLREMMPLESAEGAILLLMRDHEEATLGVLLHALAEYYDALAIVRAIVTETVNHI